MICLYYSHFRYHFNVFNFFTLQLFLDFKQEMFPAITICDGHFFFIRYHLARLLKEITRDDRALLVSSNRERFAHCKHISYFFNNTLCPCMYTPVESQGAFSGFGLWSKTLRGQKHARWPMVSALDSGSGGPGSSPGQGTALCSWARYFTLIVPLSTQVYKWVPANLLLGVTLRWTSIPSRGE